MRDELVLRVEPTLREASLVLAFAGWNDAGEAASYAVRYLDDAIQSVPLGEIDGEEFLDFTVQRPSVREGAGGSRVIDWPRTVFRYGSADGSRELILALGIEPHLRWRRFSELVADLASRFDVKRVALLGAYLADIVYSRPVGVTGFASDPALLAKVDVVASGYQGPTGIVGVLSERLAREGREVVSLWAGLPHYIHVSPNPRGALALLQKLTVHLSLRVDLEPLRRQAAEFEQRISALVAADPELDEYVRQLKRREFAQ